MTPLWCLRQISTHHIQWRSSWGCTKSSVSPFSEERVRAFKFNQLKGNSDGVPAQQLEWFYITTVKVFGLKSFCFESYVTFSFPGTSHLVHSWKCGKNSMIWFKLLQKAPKVILQYLSCPISENDLNVSISAQILSEIGRSTFSPLKEILVPGLVESNSANRCWGPTSSTKCWSHSTHSNRRKGSAAPGFLILWDAVALAAYLQLYWWYNPDEKPYKGPLDQNFCWGREFTEYIASTKGRNVRVETLCHQVREKVFSKYFNTKFIVCSSVSRSNYSWRVLKKVTITNTREYVSPPSCLRPELHPGTLQA